MQTMQKPAILHGLTTANPAELLPIIQKSTRHSKTQASKEHTQTYTSTFHMEKDILKNAEHPGGPALSTDTQDIIRSLDRLQRSTTEWLDGNSIDLGVHFHLGWLPDIVDDEINYTSTWPTGLWNDQHKGAAGLKDFRRMKEEITNPVSGDTTFLTRIHERQYTIWPTNVGNHWAVIIIRTQPMAAMQSDGGEPQHQTLVTNIAVVDPAKHQKTVNLLFQRVKEFLEYHDFVIANDSRTEIWTPKQRDNWSCGIHVYNIIKVMVERIQAVVLHNPSKYSSDIWAPLSKDFQPPKVRLELIGLLAAAAVQTLAKSTISAKVSLALL